MQVFKNKQLVFTPPWGEPGQGVKVQLWISTYAHDSRVALQLMSQADWGLEPYMTMSVNMPGEPCPDNEVWLKDYSENEGCVDHLIRWGVIEREPTAMVRSGFVTVCRWRFTAAFMMELAAVLTAGKKVRK